MIPSHQAFCKYIAFSERAIKSTILTQIAWATPAASAAYNMAISCEWNNRQAIACKSLVIIKRDWGNKYFKLVVDTGRKFYGLAPEICLCTCHQCKTCFSKHGRHEPHTCSCHICQCCNHSICFCHCHDCIHCEDHRSHKCAHQRHCSSCINEQFDDYDASYDDETYYEETYEEEYDYNEMSHTIADLENDITAARREGVNAAELLEAEGKLREAFNEINMSNYSEAEELIDEVRTMIEQAQDLDESTATETTDGETYYPEPQQTKDKEVIEDDLSAEDEVTEESIHQPVEPEMIVDDNDDTNVEETEVSEESEVEGPVDARTQQERVEEVVRKIKEATGKVIELEYVDSDEWVAEANAQDKIRISKGLVNATDNDDELAFVVSHEIIHVEEEHINKLQENLKEGIDNTFDYASKIRTDMNKNGKKVSLPGKILRNIGKAVVIAAGTAGSYVNMRYKQREFEKDSDAKATDIMEKAGYDPDGAETFLSKRYYYPRTFLQHMTSTHPSTRLRVENVRKKCKK